MRANTSRWRYLSNWRRCTSLIWARVEPSITRTGSAPEVRPWFPRPLGGGRLQQADLEGDRLGRESVVPRHHRHPDAGVAAAADGVGHFGSGRVVEAQQTEQGLARFQDLRRRRIKLFRPGSQGHGDHPEAPGGKVVVGGHHPLASDSIERFAAGRCEPAVAALQHLQRRALGDHQAAAAGDRQRRVVPGHQHRHAPTMRIEGNLAMARVETLPLRRIEAGGQRRLQHRRFGGIAYGTTVIEAGVAAEGGTLQQQPMQAPRRVPAARFPPPPCGCR